MRAKQTPGYNEVKKTQPATNQFINVEEPLENIRARADEYFEVKQYQHAMKFYEICLGKITAVTDVDLNEDQYMMQLAVQTYIGICDCALHLNLWDHLSHFASQCIQLDQNDSSKLIYKVYQMRAKAFVNQGRLE